MEQQAAIRRTIAMVVAFILLVVYGFIWRMNQPVIMNDDQLRANGAIVLNQPRIFSDFDLVDHRADAHWSGYWRRSRRCRRGNDRWDWRCRWLNDGGDQRVSRGDHRRRNVRFG